MKEFIFGSDFEYNGDRLIVKAKNLRHAIKIFKAQELFPEKYVDKQFIKKKEYRSVFNRSIYTFNPGSEPFIFIHTREKKPGSDHDYIYTLVDKISLEECINVDYRDILPAREALPAGISEDVSGLPVPGNGNSEMVSVENNLKTKMRKKHDDMLLKKKELEKMVYGLVESLNAMKEDIAKKVKVITAIETYMGVHEDVVQLLEGEQAPSDVPLHVFQQVLYMDEEVGVYDNQGIDFRRIDEFDTWIINNYKNFLYPEKSVCVFQVRRKDKDYGDAWANLKNAYNRMSYFLFRNGQNLYRIFGNVHVRERLFPTADEYEKILADGFGDEQHRMKNLNEKHSDYVVGLVYIQGLIDRTDLLGENLKGINLIKGVFTENEILLIRDAERKHWLTDGKPGWRKFLNKNRDTIEVGSRIVFTYIGRQYVSRGKDEQWRTSPFRAPFPTMGAIYVVEGNINPEWQYIKHDFVVRYKPRDDVSYLDRNGNYVYHERKNHVPYRCYRNEMLNVDNITLEECEYYIKNRYERVNYLDILPVLFAVRKVKQGEEKLENEFIRFVLGQLGWSEEKISEVKEVITWWKLKNKYKRGLMKDDAKALRMIVKKLRKNGVFNTSDTTMASNKRLKKG